MRQRLYQKLIVWKEAHSLCVWVYKATKAFPSHEQFSLTKQLRRSSASVPTSIAEGSGRRTKNDKAQFWNIAIGSLEEAHYQCLLAYELKHLTYEQFEEADDKIQRIGFLLEKLRQNILQSSASSATSVPSATSEKSPLKDP